MGDEDDFLAKLLTLYAWQQWQGKVEDGLYVWLRHSLLSKVPSFWREFRWLLIVLSYIIDVGSPLMHSVLDCVDTFNPVRNFPFSAFERLDGFSLSSFFWNWLRPGVVLFETCFDRVNMFDHPYVGRSGWEAVLAVTRSLYECHTFLLLLPCGCLSATVSRRSVMTRWHVEYHELQEEIRWKLRKPVKVWFFQIIQYSKERQAWLFCCCQGS